MPPCRTRLAFKLNRPLVPQTLQQTLNRFADPDQAEPPANPPVWPLRLRSPECASGEAACSSPDRARACEYRHRPYRDAGRSAAREASARGGPRPMCSITPCSTSGSGSAFGSGLGDGPFGEEGVDRRGPLAAREPGRGEDVALRGAAGDGTDRVADSVECTLVDGGSRTLRGWLALGLGSRRGRGHRDRSRLRPPAGALASPRLSAGRGRR